MASSGSFNTTAYSGRYLTFAWSQVSQDIENNTTKISWTLKGAGGDSTWYNTRNIKVTIEGETVYSFPQSKGGIPLSNGTQVASGEYVIKHNADGHKRFAAYVEAGIYYHAVNCTGSGDFALNTIARASQPSCGPNWPTHDPNVGYFGDTISIHMNRASSSFTHTVRYAFGPLSGTIATGVTTGTTWTIPLSFMDLLPENRSGSGRIYVDTYRGSTKIGTKWCGFTATVPDSVKPSISYTLKDVTEVDKIYGSPVQGLSKIQVTISATPAYSSPIENYAISIDGGRYTSQTITTEALRNSGSVLVVVAASDKRSRQSTREYTMNVQPYSPPKVTALRALRCNEDGTENDQGDYVKVLMSAEVTPLGNKNTAAYYCWYKKQSETEFRSGLASTYVGTPDYSPDDLSFIFKADGDSTYDIEASAVDSHNTTKRTTTVSTAFTLMNWHPSGRGMAFGKVAETEGSVEFGMDVQGRVLGLGTLELVPNNSDLNTYVLPGVYSIPTDEAAETMTNLPKVVAGRLVVSDSTGTEPAAGALYEYKEQLFLPHDIGRGGIPWVRQIRRAGSTQWTYYAWQSFALFSYPIGSIYIAYSHNSPADLFGGTWVRMENTFLWGCDAKGAIGLTGGEKTHTLTVDEMPSHSHGSVYSQHASGTKDKAWYTTSGSSVAYGTVATGGGQAHNNMPPYTQVSIWRRTG